MDEAQRLGSIDALSTDQAHAANRVIHSIHNGEMKKPVILLAAGLGSTRMSFGSFGISRFAVDTFVELGALDRESEHAVLHDWLTKDGNAIGDPTPWIHAISQETFGWPQHILAYVKPALEQLDAARGAMTEEGLAAVLEAGRARRTMYYEHRAEDFPEEDFQSLTRPFVNITIGESVQRKDIISSLRQDYDQDKAEMLFRMAEEKGIIALKQQRYRIPIPSMHEWVVAQYALAHTRKHANKIIDQS